MGRRILEAQVRDRRILAGGPAVRAVQAGNAGELPESDLQQCLPGRQFSSALRHGKRIFLRLVQADRDGPQAEGKRELPGGQKGGSKGRGVAEAELWLTLHLGLTGSLLSLDPGEVEPRHTRLLITFADGGRLAFDDPRIFGEVSLTKSPQAFLKERRIGPDALQMDEETFKGIMSGRRGLIKPALLNQRLISGLGNLYADEALFQSGICPKARGLDEEEISILFFWIQEVLKTALALGADLGRLPKSYLLPNRHPKGQCPRDGSPLCREKIGGRTSYYCPVHQSR